MWTRRPLERVRTLYKIQSDKTTCLRLARLQQRRRLSSKANESKPKANEPSGVAEQSASQLHAATIKEKLPSSVQGPSWVWTYAHQLTYPLRMYNRAQSKNPYLVQLCSSLMIYFLGDLSSQLIERPVSTTAHETGINSPVVDSVDATKQETGKLDAPAGKFQLNTDRSLRALAIGGIFSIPSYHWFLFLSNNFNVPATVPHAAIWSLAFKVVFNQIVFTPLFNSYFFGMQSLLSSKPLPTDGEGAPAGGKLSREYAEAKLEHAWHRITETVPTSWYNSCKFWPFVTAFSFTFVRPQSRSVFAGVVAIGWQSYLGILNQRAERKKRALAG